MARRSVTLASEVSSNRAKIVRLAPDGGTVRADEVVVAFDRSVFEDALRTADAQILEAKAELAQAVSSLALVEQHGLAEERGAAHRAELARLELAQVEGARGPMELADAEHRRTDALRRSKQAAARLAELDGLLERGLVTVRELEDQRALRDRAAADLHLAERALELHREVAQPTTLRRLRSELEEANSAASRSRDQTTLRLDQARAVVQRASSRLEVLQDRRARALRDLERCELKAPADGIVQHERIAIGGQARKPQVGDSVWSGQAIVTLSRTPARWTSSWRSVRSTTR